MALPDYKELKHYLTQAVIGYLNVTDNTAGVVPIDLQNADYAVLKARIDAGYQPIPADAAPLKFTANQALENRITTTDATVTAIFTGTLAQNTGYWANLVIIGVDTGNGNMMGQSGRIMAKRLTGNAIIVGSSLDTPIGDVATGVGQQNWQVSASVANAILTISVKGFAGRTISWSLSGSFISFTPSGA